MMISPETYYRDTLEGQSPEFILRQIHSLRREIRRLIRLMETDPMNLVQALMNHGDHLIGTLHRGCQQ